MSKNAVLATIKAEQDIERRIDGERNAYQWRESVMHITSLCYDKCFGGGKATARGIHRARNCANLYRETTEFITDMLMDLQES